MANTSGDPTSDVVEEALATAQRSYGRQIAVFRFTAVTTILAFTLAMGSSRVEWVFPGWWLLWAYWIAATALLLVGRSSERVARAAGLTVPFLDMPFVYLLARGTADDIRAAGRMADAAGSTLQAESYFLMLLFLASLTLNPRWTFVAAAVGGGLEALLVWRAGLNLPLLLLPPAILMLAATAFVWATDRALGLVRRATTERQKRERLARYFAPQVAAHLETAAESAKGVRREITVLFCDLRNFTALAEQLGAEEIVALLDRFHTRMVEVIFAHGGTLDKFLGDGLMAYFGAPLSQSDHAARAVRCGLAMHAALVRFGVERSSEGAPPLGMGIGIHTGTAVVGDVGPPMRREFTAIGDPVNVAARIMELTKARGIPILVSGATARAAAEATTFVPVGIERLRGRAEAVELYTPIARADASP